MVLRSSGFKSTVDSRFKFDESRSISEEIILSSVENCFFMELTHPWHVMPDIWYSDLYMDHPKSERLSRIVVSCFLIGLVEKIITKEDTKHNIERT